MVEAIDTEMINGEEWERLGPYCQICGAHMGDLYHDKSGKFKNPHNYEDYGRNKCPKCGQEYEYNEGDMVDLSDEQLDVLRKHAGLKGG